MSKQELTDEQVRDMHRKIWSVAMRKSSIPKRLTIRAATNEFLVGHPEYGLTTDEALSLIARRAQTFINRGTPRKKKVEHKTDHKDLRVAKIEGKGSSFHLEIIGTIETEVPHSEIVLNILNYLYSEGAVASLTVKISP